MKLKEQVVSLELAKKMKELGFKQESLWWWVREDAYSKDDGVLMGFSEWYLVRGQNMSKEGFCDIKCAYTVAELGELILGNCNEYAQGWNDSGCFYHFQYGNRGSGNMMEGIGRNYSASDDDTETNARAKMLINLKEKGLL